MPELTVTSQTTLQQLRDFQNEVKGSGGHEVRGTRNKDGSITLYTKDPKSFSFGFKKDAREGKFTAAKDAILQVLQQTAKATGARNEDATTTALVCVFSKHVTGSKEALSVSGMGKMLRDASIQAQEVPLQETASRLTGQIDALRSQVLSKLDELPSLPRPLVEFAGSEPWRASAGSDRAILQTMQKVEDGQMESLSWQQTIGVVRKVAPLCGGVSLETLKELSSTGDAFKACGTYTAQNTVGKKVVESATPESMREGAEALRDMIAELPQPDQLRLKAAAKFVRDLATGYTDKLGLMMGSTDQQSSDLGWMKSHAVNFATVLGFDNADLIKTSEDQLQAMNDMRDLVTAMAMHFDTIFPTVEFATV